MERHGPATRVTDKEEAGRPATVCGHPSYHGHTRRADEHLSASRRAHIYGCRRQVRVAHGDCAFPQIGSSKIGRRVGPLALLQCSDLGAQSAAAAGLQDAGKAAVH